MDIQKEIELMIYQYNGRDASKGSDASELAERIVKAVKGEDHAKKNNP